MARRVIITHRAQAERLRILDYYYKQTGNKNYSKKLDQNFKRIFKIISQYPQIGRKITSKDFIEIPENFEQLSEIRFFVYQQYQIFYLAEGADKNSMITILQIWDTRQYSQGELS